MAVFGVIMFVSSVVFGDYARRKWSRKWFLILTPETIYCMNQLQPVVVERGKVTALKEAEGNIVVHYQERGPHTLTLGEDPALSPEAVKEYLRKEYAEFQQEDPGCATS